MGNIFCKGHRTPPSWDFPYTCWNSTCLFEITLMPSWAETFLQLSLQTSVCLVETTAMSTPKNYPLVAAMLRSLALVFSTLRICVHFPHIKTLDYFSTGERRHNSQRPIKPKYTWRKKKLSEWETGQWQITFH